MVLGKIGATSLDNARERAEEMLQWAKRGVDLDKQERSEVAKRETEERAKANRLTVHKAVDAYVKAFETTASKRTGRTPATSSIRQAGVWLRRLIEKHGDVALDDLTADQVQEIIDATPPASRRNVYGAMKRLTPKLIFAGACFMLVFVLQAGEAAFAQAIVPDPTTL